MALVFTDLEGSSALSEQFGDAFETQRETHFEILRGPIDELNGYEVETAGDSLFAVFPDVLSAALWSLRSQAALQNHDWPAFIGPIKVRIGIHVGTPFVGRDKKTGGWTFRGPVTNRTARLMGAGHGGQILLSHQASQLLGTAPKTETRAAVRQGSATFELRDLGVYRLKGIGDEKIWQLSAPGLRVEFPDLAAIPARRHNLPLPATPFFGHSASLERWRALLLKPATRLLTLCAFGGMGKTRTALQLAEDCALDFEDGVWWVSLENARSEAAMLAQIAASLPFEVGVQTPALDQIQEFLREKSLLLVLDNTEQIEAAARVVKAIMDGAPHLKILVTSRHALQLQSEIVREVPPLSVTESARLFCERAAALGRTYQVEDATIRRIVQSVEGVPLALELSASLTGVLSPPQILERLKDQLKLLRSRSPDLPDRQRALRATMDWSFEMLDSQDQEVFAGLSVFSGGFSLDDAEAVTGNATGLDDIFLSIQELYRRSLLRAQEIEAEEGVVTRYFMLESVRAYAQEQLAKNPAQSQLVHSQHARHYVEKMGDFAAKMRGEAEANALKSAALDFDNARSALRFLSASKPLELAQLALFYGRVLQRVGLLKEAGERFQNGLDALDTVGRGSDLFACLQLERAGAFLDLLDIENAEKLVAEAFSHFQSQNAAPGKNSHGKNPLPENAQSEAECRYLLGLIALQKQGSCDTARAHFEAALQFFEDTQGIEKAMVRNVLGLCALQNLEFERAEADFGAALQLYRACNYGRGAADALTNLGVLAQEQGNYPAARQRYREALELEMRSGAQSGLARALSNAGEIELLLENWDGAARILAAATTLFDRAGSPVRQHSFGLLETACVEMQRVPDEFLRESSEKTMEELAGLALETT